MLNYTLLSERTSPRCVRLSGTLRAVRHNDRTFTLALRSGDQVKCFLRQGTPEMLVSHLGKVAVIGGIAYFRPAGSLLRVDVDAVMPGSDLELALWSESPRPLFARPDAPVFFRLQGAQSGLESIIGAWPGDETDDEIFALLDEIS